MQLAVIGLGKMGRALSGRLLDAGHVVSVWNRTPGHASTLLACGATEVSSPDEIDPRTDAVFVCLADDHSVLDVASRGGAARENWSRSVVAAVSTVSPETLTVLQRLYGDRFVAAPILGAPQAVTSGDATFIIGGAASARTALSPIWQLFAGPIDVGDEPARAAVIKLMQNQLLLTGIAVMAETVRVGQMAGLDEATLVTMLENSPMVPSGLRNRITGLFDPQHAGWFTSPLAAKDLGHFLGLAPDECPLPVTRAAQQAYVQIADDGWGAADVTALVELGTE